MADADFKGFPPGKSNTVPIHAQFFSEVLPLIDNLAEMKVVLFCYWALLQKNGRFRYLLRKDFATNEALMQGLAAMDAADDGDLPEQRLDAGLARAVEHHILLRADVKLDSGDEQLYFVNTARGRTAVQQLAAGNWQPSTERPVEILPERPTIYQLYEDNIGPLTAMIAERLQDAEDEYSAEWVADAITLAVENNARSWRYIEAILTRWEEEGRVDAKTRRTHATDHEFAGQQWSDFADD